MLRWIATVGLAIALLAWPAGAAAEAPRLLVTEVRASTDAADLVTLIPGKSSPRTLLPGRPGLRRGLLPGDTPSWS